MPEILSDLSILKLALLLGLAFAIKKAFRFLASLLSEGARVKVRRWLGLDDEPIPKKGKRGR